MYPTKTFDQEERVRQHALHHAHVHDQIGGMGLGNSAQVELHAGRDPHRAGQHVDLDGPAGRAGGGMEPAVVMRQALMADWIS